MSTALPQWVIDYDEPDQTWYIAVDRDGAIIRLNGHYLTRESAELDKEFLEREYVKATRVTGKEASLFN